MKKIAHSIHHTHWDLIWYFTVQDADVQFAYNMKELLNAFDNKEVNQFFLDGQTAPIDTYIRLYPEDEQRISKYVSSGKLVIGPFNSQLDSFITSGESVINNLRLGHKTAERLGKVSKIAYLPDSFGHSIDYPKIFNQFGIHDFVITRGVGDEYDLGSEFHLKSSDQSELLVYTMIAGYGYGCYPFKEGTLFSDAAVDYNKIDVHKLIERLLSYSTIENEFVFPLGFDQNPMIYEIDNKIERYNEMQDEIKFIETDWEEFFDTIRAKGKNIKTHTHELISTQYHRVHRSIYSARADIKALQDKCERILTYELQPMMTLLDSLGIEYNHGLIDRAWETLILCQTHSSANLTDETNDYIKRETQNALNLAYSHKSYLLKLMSISLNMKNNDDVPLIVFSTIPNNHDEVINARVFTKTDSFNLYYDSKKIPYITLKKERKNNGVLRKDPLKINNNKFYYETDIQFLAKNLEGISYRTYLIKEETQSDAITSIPVSTNHFIENEYYKVFQNSDGVSVLDKRTGEVHETVLFIEDVGDEGDSFDYSYPTKDSRFVDYFDNASVNYTDTLLQKTMSITGNLEIPKDLKERSIAKTSSILKYNIKLVLESNSTIIKVNGTFNNDAEQHRVRLVFTGDEANDYSFAGTQYGYIKRKTYDESHENWRERGYFEEPSSIYPLLNHVSSVNEDKIRTIYTRSSKEYEFVGEGYKNIGVTIFRSYGALGYPDLNRRPGRPSGMDYTVFETPKCQMKGDNEFELGFSFDSEFNENEIFNQYVSFATNSSVYQKQTYNQSINPIDYFPTNPTRNSLPLHYRLLEVKKGEGVFGSIVKSETTKAYLLRLFNSSDRKTKLGNIESDNVELTFKETNLEETKINDSSDVYQAGELKIIRVIKEEK